MVYTEKKKYLHGLPISLIKRLFPNGRGGDKKYCHALGQGLFQSNLIRPFRAYVRNLKGRVPTHLDPDF